VITECAAICAYLADAFPQAGLAPPPEDRAAYYRWFFFAAGPVEYAVANRAAGFEASADKQRILGYGSYETVLDTLDTLLSHTTFATGEHFRAVDVYLGAQIGWGLQFGTIEKRPAFEAYAGRVMDRDAARRAAALDNALAQQLSASA
jgi:glutathione S-transferase